MRRYLRIGMVVVGFDGDLGGCMGALRSFGVLFGVFDEVLFVWMFD